MLPVCPRKACSEMAASPDATHCAECGTRLTPTEKALERLRRVYDAMPFVAADVNRLEHAELIVTEVRKRDGQGKTPWPKESAA